MIRMRKGLFEYSLKGQAIYEAYLPDTLYHYLNSNNLLDSKEHLFGSEEERNLSTIKVTAQKIQLGTGMVPDSVVIEKIIILLINPWVMPFIKKLGYVIYIKRLKDQQPMGTSECALSMD